MSEQEWCDGSGESEEALADTEAILHVECHGDPPRWLDAILCWIFRAERWPDHSPTPSDTGEPEIDAVSPCPGCPNCEKSNRAKPYVVDLWICLNCAYPCQIEDGGFYPEDNYIKDGGHPAGFTIECGLCCHDEWIKVAYEATTEGNSVWIRRRDGFSL